MRSQNHRKTFSIELGERLNKVETFPARRGQHIQRQCVFSFPYLVVAGEVDLQEQLHLTIYFKQSEFFSHPNGHFVSDFIRSRVQIFQFSSVSCVKDIRLRFVFICQNVWTN